MIMGDLLKNCAFFSAECASFTRRYSDHKFRRDPPFSGSLAGMDAVHAQAASTRVYQLTTIYMMTSEQKVFQPRETSQHVSTNPSGLSLGVRYLTDNPKHTISNLRKSSLICSRKDPPYVLSNSFVYTVVCGGCGFGLFSIVYARTA